MADSDSEFDMVSHFGAVDELIQLIYQGSNKFVLISAVDNVHWTLHLGLTGVGRWWKGQWTVIQLVSWNVHALVWADQVSSNFTQLHALPVRTD